MPPFDNPLPAISIKESIKAGFAFIARPEASFLKILGTYFLVVLALGALGAYLPIDYLGVEEDAKLELITHPFVQGLTLFAALPPLMYTLTRGLKGEASANYFAYFISSVTWCVVGGYLGAYGISLLGMLALVVPGLYLFVRFTFIMPHTVVRGRIELGEAFRLSKGLFWKILAVCVVTFLPYLVFAVGLKLVGALDITGHLPPGTNIAGEVTFAGVHNTWVRHFVLAKGGVFALAQTLMLFFQLATIAAISHLYKSVMASGVNSQEAQPPQWHVGEAVEKGVSFVLDVTWEKGKLLLAWPVVLLMGGLLMGSGMNLLAEGDKDLMFWLQLLPVLVPFLIWISALTVPLILYTTRRVALGQASFNYFGYLMEGAFWRLVVLNTLHALYILGWAGLALGFMEALPLVSALIMLVSASLYVWLYMRLSLLYPHVCLHNRLAFREIFTLSKGHLRAIFTTSYLSTLISWAMMSVVLILMTIVFLKPEDGFTQLFEAGDVQSVFMLLVLALSGLVMLVGIQYLGLLGTASFAHLYKNGIGNIFIKDKETNKDYN